MADPTSTRTPQSAPLQGIRVIEDSHTTGAELAGCLLADLGADVVRVNTAEEQTNPARNRGKRHVTAGDEDVRSLIRRADLVLTDRPAEDRGLWTPAAHPDAHQPVWLWMPAYGAHDDAASGLPADPMLVAALTGLAAHPPLGEMNPVAGVVDLIGPTHAALGATAAVAGLVGRERGCGSRSVEVSGPHTVALMLIALMIHGIDTDVVRFGTTGLMANWRPYQAADGQWLFLASLTGPLFVEALSALDRTELLVMPGIDGDLTKMWTDPTAAAALGAALEEHFATEPRDHWLELFRRESVPCAVVADREAWRRSDLARDLNCFRTEDHPELGPVDMAALPISLTGIDTSRPTGFQLDVPFTEIDWDEPSTPATADHAGESTTGPLAGLRVVESASFLAAPSIGSILADLGAEVVKVEAPGGDPYREFTLPFLALNQRKSSVCLDLTEAGDHRRFLQLLSTSDVLVDNLRPQSAARLDLGDQAVRSVNADITRCSVTAFGTTGADSDLPGFDPVIQSMSGLAAAQGGSGAPALTTLGANDSLTGALGALGVAVGLFSRVRKSVVIPRIDVSLAQATAFLQFDAFTQYAGAPIPEVGGPSYPGPFLSRSYRECADGWVAFAATDPSSDAALLAALAATTDDVVEVLSHRRVDDVISLAREIGVPACRIVTLAEETDAALIADNAMLHIVRHLDFGRVSLAAGFSDWEGCTPATARSVPLGADTQEVLGGLGITEP
ncbi:CoA transferase [Gordonia hydrophobica]|uniref:CoA transferase n=1 Tax=Gordonia hydrophobica TaxID=40516 RepID=A0ABZ2TZS6_9ACTN|nr:CoA transferase [Gordonia hydrophobica]MBM7369217.1 crotonobetainyl-CoA:carnitine CoA-transferase CaiB-like acyl-CoA transferase [Gordonia hydrophobica]